MSRFAFGLLASVAAFVPPTLPTPTKTFDFTLGTFPAARTVPVWDPAGSTWEPNNLAVHSSNFANAAWNKNACTVGSDATTGPSGATTGDALIPNSGSVSAYFESGTLAASGHNFIASAYIKNGTLGTNWVQLIGFNGGVYRAWFNVLTGAAGSTQGSPLGSGIASIGSGWYRIWIVVPGVVGNFDKLFIKAEAADNVNGNVTGDGSTPALYVDAAQLEHVTTETTPRTYHATTTTPWLGTEGVTFSRTTLATKTDSTGAVTWCTNNFALQSEDLAGAAWSKDTGVTVTGTQATGLGGDHPVNLSVINEGTAGTRKLLYQEATNTVAAYIVSAYIAAGTQRYVHLSSHTKARIVVDTVGWTITATAGAATNSTLTNIGGGIYRASFRVPANTLITYLTIGGAGSADPGTYDPTYTGTGQTIIAGGIQYEIVTHQTAPRVYHYTTSSPYYGPRLDYDPSTLASKGLLIEPAATNLALQSDNLADAAWLTLTTGAGSLTRTANSGVAPDGTTSAAKIELNRDNAAQYAEIYQTFTAPGTTVGSFYLKAFAGGDVGKQILLTFYSGGSAGTINPTLTADWQRIEFAAPFSAGASVSVILGYANTVDVTGATAQIGPVSFYAWGGQMEAGAVATSYIPTASSSVTRAADVVSVDGTNFSSWFNQSEGAFLVEAKGYDTNQLGPIIEATETTLGNGFHAIWQADTAFGGAGKKIVAGTATGGSFVSMFSTTGNDAVSFKKSALAYKANDFALAVDGTLVGTDTSGALSSNITILNIGQRTGLNYWSGHVKKISYFNTRPSNTDLQALAA